MNPQSLNRYAYVSGQPLAYTDPSGLNMFGLIPPEAGLGNIWAECIILGVDLFADLFSLFRHHDPPFHGSLKPRPSSGIADFPDGESLGMPTGMNANFGGALGAIVPATSSCEFGACGGISSFGQRKTGARFDPVSPFDQATFGAGLYLIYQTYKEMEKANVKGSDKFFHCIAMARASSLGPGGEAAAVTASWGREITDTVKYRWYLIIGNPHGLNFRDSIVDSREDLKADYAGINGGVNGCAQYRVRGLP